MTDEIEFEDGPEVPQAPAAQPELVAPIKRRGRPPKIKAQQEPAPQPVSQPEPEPEPEPKAPKTIIVQTRYPYAMHCSSQNVLIPADTPTKVEPDYWIQSQIDAGLLIVL